MNKYICKMIEYASEKFPYENNVKLLTERIVGIEDNIIYVNKRLYDSFREIKFSWDIAKLFEILVACDLEKDFYFRIIDHATVNSLGSYNLNTKNVEPYILKLAMRIASDIAYDRRAFMKLMQIAIEHDEIDNIKGFFISFIDEGKIIKNIECSQLIIELLNIYEEGDIVL